MKIKLLPFEEARKKAEENGFHASNQEIFGISKTSWDRDCIQVINCNEGDNCYYAFDFAYPKCCCEVIEE